MGIRRLEVTVQHHLDIQFFERMPPALAYYFHHAHMGFAVMVGNQFHIRAGLITCRGVSLKERMKQRFAQEQINTWPRDEFVRVFGGVFEHSPWIAEAAWARRPFASPDALHRTMCETVRNANPEVKLALIRAHPDLVGRAALAGTLTPESTNEQASAGLNHLTPEEILFFQRQNSAYKERFGFPFVICARLNKKHAIIEAFEKRLKNLPEEEIQTALEEIFKIAALRLNDIIVGEVKI